MNTGSGDSSDADWASLSEQLDRALELPDDEREAWLTELRGRSPAMAQRIEALFARRRAAGYAGFLTGKPVVPERIEGVTLVGRSVGPYRIESEAGRGGMGSVWRARRVDGLYEGVVAVKLIHRSWLGRGAEERFRTEGRLLGRLEHPNIARLVDAGVLDDQQPYLVLEFVEGLPIDEYCAQHSLSRNARIRLFLGVLQAVAHAHSHLIVHRDLKPGNIFVTADGTPKLLDFGIAKLLSSDAGSEALTRAGQVAMTPQYAAPEQLCGEAITTGTDIYTLGLVLYVLLTGRPPYPADGTSPAEFAQAVLTREPPRASAVGAISTVPPRSLRGDLDNILGKALKRDPAERYRSVTDFADDLKRLLDHEPVQAHADTVGYRVSKFVRRHRGTVVGGVLATIALIATTAFALWQMIEARAQRDVAAIRTQEASAHAELSEFMLGDSLGEAPKDLLSRRLDRARDFVYRRFAADPLRQAQLLISLSGREIDIGDTVAGTRLMREAEAIAKKIDDPHLNANIACGRGQDDADAGDLAGARAQEAVAVRNMQRLERVPSGLLAECALLTSYLTRSSGEPERGIAALRGAMDALEADGVQRTSRYTSIAHEHARSYVLVGRFREGWEAEQKVMAIAVSVGREFSAPYFAMFNVAMTASTFGGQPRHTVELLRQLQQKARGASVAVDVPFYLEGSELLAAAAAGMPTASDSRLASVAAIAAENGLERMSLQCLVAAVRVALLRGDVESAERAVSALDTAMKAMKLQDPIGGALEASIAHALVAVARDDARSARTTLDETARLVPERDRRNTAVWRRYLIARAEADLALGDAATAATDALAARTRAEQEAIDPRSSAWIGEALVWHARAELARGDRAAAAISAREALPHLESNLDPAHPLIAAARGMLTAS